MTSILTDVAWWLLSAILLGPGWFSISCFIGCLWAIENWRIRL